MSNTFGPLSASRTTVCNWSVTLMSSWRPKFHGLIIHVLSKFLNFFASFFTLIAYFSEIKQLRSALEIGDKLWQLQVQIVGEHKPIRPPAKCLWVNQCTEAAGLAKNVCIAPISVLYSCGNQVFHSECRFKWKLIDETIWINLGQWSENILQRVKLSNSL